MPTLPVRDRADARLAGVCAALARAWSVDPLLLRVVVVVLTVMTNGFMAAAYVALWVLLPDRGGESPLHRLLPTTRRWSFASVVTVLILVTVTVGGIISGSGSGAFFIIALAWVILRFGFAGRRSSGPADAPIPPPPPVTAFERAAQAWQQRVDNIAAGRPADWLPPLPAAPSAPDPTAAVRRRRGGRIWLGTLATLGAVWTGLGIATALDVVVLPVVWASASLLVLGLALLWSALAPRASRGRPALLLPTTIVTAVATAALIAPAPTPLPLVGAPPAPVGAEVVSLPIGEHTIDLSDHQVSDEVRRYQQDVGVLVVSVPRSGNIEVRTLVGLGDVSTPAGTAEGVDASRTWSRITDDNAPTLTLDLWVGIGEIEVRS